MSQKVEKRHVQHDVLKTLQNTKLMSKNLKLARHHLERIEYYHQHAGPAGYNQARPHYEQLGEILLRSAKSEKRESDVILIQALIQSAEPLMKSMEAYANQENSNAPSGEAIRKTSETSVRTPTTE